MIVRSLLLASLLPVLAAAASPDEQRRAGESARAFVVRVLKPSPDTLQVVETVWNGRPVVFADHLVSRAEQRGHRSETRVLDVLVRQDSGRWRRVAVTRAEEEGGVAEVAAVGFANADRDAGRELIVLLKWPQVHYDYSGDFYEVRLFDTPQPGRPALTYLARASRIFGGIGCECGSRDGRRTHFRFNSIALVRRELARHGY